MLALDQGKTFADLDAWTSTDQPPWSVLLGFKESAPGGQSTLTAPVTQGPIYLVCFASSPDKKVVVVGPLEVGK
jgi:hypothetical protein